MRTKTAAPASPRRAGLGARLGTILAAAVALAPAGPAAAQTADEVLARLDAGASFRTIRYAGRMEITIGGKTRAKTMVAMAEGSEKAFIEFTNPEDRGTRYLKLGKDLWMYFPKDDETVKISGHMLKNGMMGSDVSYEDALESRDYKLKYSASLEGQETLDGRRCFVVRLEAKAKDAPYEARRLWVDAERWVSLKEEMYAKSGMLLKVSRSLAVERVGARWYPVKVEMESRLRKDTKTLFVMEELSLDPALPADAFTMGALTR